MCSHLRLCVDIGSIGDQLFDDFRLAGQRGYVQSSVSFLDYTEQAQECVLRCVAPVRLHCVRVCVCVNVPPPLAPLSRRYLSPTLCAAGVFQLCPSPLPHPPHLHCQQCATSGR